SAKAYYDKEAAQLLKDVGVPVPKEPLTSASQPVAVEPFGVEMINRANGRLAAADAHFNATVQAAREALQRRATAPAAYDATLKALQAAEQNARSAAQMVVDAEFLSLNHDMANVVKMAKADGNPGDLTRLVDEKIKALRGAVGKRASILYDAAD